MRVHDIQRIRGGYEITVEVPRAYTDGTSRYDIVFIDAEAVDTAPTDAAVLGLVQQAIAQRRPRRLRGRSLDEAAPPPAPPEPLAERLARLEDRLARIEARLSRTV